MTDEAEARAREAFAALIEASDEVERLRSVSYKARNGKKISIQADDGERIDLVHSDQTHDLKVAADSARAALAAWTARVPSEDAWTFVQVVHDTFKRDIEQGFKTRDKKFAIDLLSKALEGAPAKDDRSDAVGEIAVTETKRAMADASVFGIGFLSIKLIGSAPVIERVHPRRVTVYADRARAADERADAPTDEVLKSAREFIASEREDYIQCCTINGDMTTMDDLDRKGLAEYDTVLALLDADRDREGAR
jgi:hypothetical protein